MDQNQLVERLTEGHNDAFEYLYDHYASMLFGIILKIVPVQEEAENLLQVALLKYGDISGAMMKTKADLQPGSSTWPETPLLITNVLKVQRSNLKSKTWKIS